MLPMDGEALAQRIRDLALAFPETYEDHPWGDFPVFKVPSNKVFAWLTIEPEQARLTVKVTPEERDVALLLPFVSIARYVGRYGWITATVGDDETLEAALEWLRESYWLKAPARLRDAAFR
jgi:predicted DNA-binding protein (MmcQ/YjbR family)